MTERRPRFCSNCGAEIDIRAKICPKCGVEQAPLVEEVSDAWYLLPFFFTIIGGLIAWFVNKDRDPKKARNFIIFGFIWAIAVGIIYILFVAAFIATIVSTFPYTISIL
ncbi:MAG: zinc-ribbon domain-containing protein [Candidatus Bathyarchaeota archaeon]